MPLMALLVDWTQLRKNISELEDIAMETSKTENKKEQSGIKKTTISKNCWAIIKAVTYT